MLFINEARRKFKTIVVISPIKYIKRNVFLDKMLVFLENESIK
ncbi:hypothetical protein LEP1GSC008_0503 [Leptospira kirschneri serovar Bulgarica str. Nikolaevo]|uniref:Uncharacterized protein n=2 Tax=Leptospira kirschneri TaxID=29507 RepID=A0A0E2B8T0_9LEPT|nr:hypothetical protein LEP1GSC081_0093 [Leptospira kirschneri str. H1]EMK23688.1 hypothetical protein LEP1GSC008_0503 [Leptospira kirschneri serovar Bulgarica str. Nikolaevo]